MKNLILALDCSLRRTNVAVLSGLGGEGEGTGKILASESLDLGRRQAAELPLAVERVLAAAAPRREESGLPEARPFEAGLSEIGLVAVTNGPGYFTGLRVGVSYATALAYGLGVGVAPVSTLRMLAYPYAGAAVLALVYAGRSRVYAASFGCGGSDLPAGEYGLAALESWLSSRAEQTGQKTMIVSDDPQKAAQTLGVAQISGLPVLTSLPDASAVARIARREREMAVAPMTLRISYLREPQIG